MRAESAAFNDDSDLFLISNIKIKHYTNTKTKTKATKIIINIQIQYL